MKSLVVMTLRERDSGDPASSPASPHLVRITQRGPNISAGNRGSPTRGAFGFGRQRLGPGSGGRAVRDNVLRHDGSRAYKDASHTIRCHPARQLASGDPVDGAVDGTMKREQVPAAARRRVE